MQAPILYAIRVVNPAPLRGNHGQSDKGAGEGARKISVGA